MKFQPLFLPLVLWLIIGASIVFIPPQSFLVIGIIVMLMWFAVYFTMRLFTHTMLPQIVASCVFLALVANLLMGFNIMNLLLIGAIGTLISILVK